MSLLLNSRRHQQARYSLGQFFFISLLLMAVLLISGCLKDDIQGYLNDLKSTNFTVRKTAVHSLGKAKAKEAVPALTKLLKTESSKSVKLYIIDALAAINDPASVKALIILLKEDDPDVQMAAVDALGVMKATDAVGPLISLLQSLGVMKATDTVEPLISLLQSHDSTIKLRLLRALGNIKDDKAVPVLTRLLDDPDRYVKFNAAQALKKIGERN